MLTITPSYVIFVMTSHEIDLEHMKKEAGTHFRRNAYLVRNLIVPCLRASNAQVLTTDNFQPNRFGVLPRRNPKPEQARWFDSLKDHYWGHLCNHFEEDGIIYIDAFMHNNDSLRAFPPMHPEVDAAKSDVPPVGKFVRFKIDPHSKSTEMELPTILSDVPGELARCDDRYAGKPYKHAFGGSFGPMGFEGITHTNIATGLTKVWKAGEHTTIGEPCFVPRSADSPEGDGYLFTCCQDQETGYGSLAILDTADINAGPIAVIELPFRAHDGVHGQWVITNLFSFSKQELHG